MPRLPNSQHMLLAVGCRGRNCTTPLGLGSVTTPTNTISLCDIGSGYKSHELVGHTGSVLDLAWNPRKEFMLASASEDCTVRLWDIRKSGSTACLSILNRESDPSISTLLQEYEHTPKESTHKRQKRACKPKTKATAAPNNYTHSEQTHIQSHNGPVSTLTFTPDGMHLLSASIYDGLIRPWDVSGIASGSTGMPLIPLPLQIEGVSKKKSKASSKIPMVISQMSSIQSTALWYSHDWSIHGTLLHQHTRIPPKVLSGHLNLVSCLTLRDDEYGGGITSGELFSGSVDGMVLRWGLTNEKSSGRTGVEEVTNGYNWKHPPRRDRPLAGRKQALDAKHVEEDEDVDCWDWYQ